MSENNSSDKGLENDKELEELLDSAIEDFNKPAPPPPSKEIKPEEPEKGEDDEWGVEFLEEVQKQFEQNMKALFGQESLEDGAAFAPEQFGAHLQKMAQEANKVLNEHAKNPEFTETIAQTLKNLSENAENIDADLATNNIASMMEGLGLNGPDLSQEMFPLIQTVMKSFLSKEMLYRPIKEIVEKYPSWLEDHKSNLDEKDYESYKKQLHLMEEVCKEFEEESDNDSEDVKSKRFNKILGLMEEMQKLGQPPKDLVGEGGPFGLDENNLTNQLPGVDQSQCSLM